MWFSQLSRESTAVGWKSGDITAVRGVNYSKLDHSCAGEIDGKCYDYTCIVAACD